MKFTYTILLLSILFLLAALPLSTAAYLPPDYVKSRRSHSPWEKGPNHSWDIHDTSRGEYICDVTKASPFRSDVDGAADDLGRQAQKAMCTCGTQFDCTTVATRGAAEVGICNIWKGGLPCRTVGKVVRRIQVKCAHRFKGDPESRTGGKAVFDWGTIIVS